MSNKQGPEIHALVMDHPDDAVAEITDLRAEVARLRAFVAKPPKHRFWGAGEPDCPKDIKGGNGELHTLRCKVCGVSSPPDDVCRAAVQPNGVTRYPVGHLGDDHDCRKNGCTEAEHLPKRVPLLDEAHILICQVVAAGNMGQSAPLYTHNAMRAWLEKFSDRAAIPTDAAP